MQNQQLIRKYNVPGPRYTSYPTVPYWDIFPTENEWKQEVKNAFDVSNTSDGISIYIHLPYCESLCTYCGCNTRITVNHKVEEAYIKLLLKEWGMYWDLFEEKPYIQEIHLGGGTPTFFSPENLAKLIKGIFKKSIVKENAELGFEAHPKNTTQAHLQTLYDLGFRRLSLGIQDFDIRVQEIVNRVQTYEQVKEVTDNARKIGYASINFDLIYGLPLQTKESVKHTLDLTQKLRPERIAFYSYAHVPWIKPGQRKFTELDLPSNEEKRALYELGKQIFEKQGYIEIGMDHFALPEDKLAIAFKNKALHRNFMGYASHYTRLMVGLGVSSIGDSWTAFAQNIKKVEDYKEAVLAGSFPIFRGHLLNEEDKILRQHILNVMCHFETNWQKEELQTEMLYVGLEKLEAMQKDGLLVLEPYSLKVTPKGQAFVRNICMALDARLLRKKPTTELFSQTI